MKIAKPMLLVTTPIGVAAGLYECVRLAGGLVIVMLAMVGVMLAALASVIATIRREERAARRPALAGAGAAAASSAAQDVAVEPGVICKS